jgi:transposase-like protein
MRLWDNAWDTLIPFLEYNIEMRRVLATTNGIESLSAWFRRATRQGGASPTTTRR